MNRSSLLAVTVAAATLLLAAAPVSAVYHPTLGRFLQRDPIGYADGMSLYEYAVSSPHNRTDPWGSQASGTLPTTDGVCCCEVEPEKCKIEVNLRWLRQPTVQWSSVVEDSGDRGWSPNARRTVTVALLAFGAQAFAEVTVTHEEGDDVTGCHLKQDVHAKGNWNMNRRVSDELGDAARQWHSVPKFFHRYREERGHRYLEYTISDDYSSKMGGRHPTYRGWTYTDDPHAGGRWRSWTRSTERPDWSLRETLRWWWQAHVTVEEAPKVETWWGYEFNLPARVGVNVVGGPGDLWEGQPRQVPTFPDQ